MELNVQVKAPARNKKVSQTIDLKPDTAQAINFLKELKPDGPWLLIAIDKNGKLNAKSFASTQATGAKEWVEAHNRKSENIYYVVAETKTAINRKPAKAGMAKTAFVWVDCDLPDGTNFGDEASVEAARKRRLAEIEKFTLPPTVVVDSGSGYQVLWQLDEPAMLDGDPAKGNAPATQAFEALNLGLSHALGADACHNCDRLLRLPGTINWPFGRKAQQGRKPTLARLVSDDPENTYSVEKIAEFVRDHIKAVSTNEKAASVGEGEARLSRDELFAQLSKRLQIDIGRATSARNLSDKSRSAHFHSVTVRLCREGLNDAEIVSVLSGTPCAEKYESRLAGEVARSRESWGGKLARNPIFGAARIDWPDVTRHGSPAGNSIGNVEVALASLDVRIYFDAFLQIACVERGNSRTPFDEEMKSTLWREVHELGLKVTKAFFTDALKALCFKTKKNCLLEYYASLKWDGQCRVDALLVEHLGAEKNAYTRAVARLFMTALVRRIKRPGCKYDYMIVLVGEQGIGKSLFLKTLAEEKYFLDKLEFDAEPKEVITATRGKRIVETAELKGVKNKDLETVKSFITKTHDSGRLVYETEQREVPRQFILVGTTNFDSDLPADASGNRRFLPIKVSKMFDANRLRAELDQLFAEAVEIERTYGEKLTLPESVIEHAKRLQKAATMVDPQSEIIKDTLQDVFGCVPKVELYKLIFGIDFENKRHVMGDYRIAKRIKEVASTLGFEEKEKAPLKVRALNGERPRCFIRLGDNGEGYEGGEEGAIRLWRYQYDTKGGKLCEEVKQPLTEAQKQRIDDIRAVDLRLAAAQANPGQPRPRNPGHRTH